MNVGDRVRLNGDVGTITEVHPGGSDVVVRWDDDGPSDIAGRELWCPVAYLERDPPTLETAYQLATKLPA